MAGRPRSAAADRAILGAALAEYAEGGLDGMSVDAVAARAGVSKATIYRRYPSKGELVVAAVVTIVEEGAPRPDTGSLHGDITELLHNLRRLLSDPVVGPAVRMFVADAQHHAELAGMHAEFLARRRLGSRSVMQRAIDRGELPGDLDVDFAIDTLTAPLFYRHLVLRQALPATYVEKVVADFFARYGVPERLGR